MQAHELVLQRVIPFPHAAAYCSDETCVMSMCCTDVQQQTEFLCFFICVSGRV